MQRPSEHPFIKRLIPSMADQHAAQEALRLGPGLPRIVEGILDRNSWHYTITGAHRGGGLDSTLIIEKTERSGRGGDMLSVEQLLAEYPPEASPAQAIAALYGIPHLDMHPHTIHPLTGQASALVHPTTHPHVRCHHSLPS